MRHIANAVTMCRFESTDRASDQVVLSKILQACPLLQLSFHNKHGDFVWSMLQAAGGCTSSGMREAWPACCHPGMLQAVHSAGEHMQPCVFLCALGMPTQTACLPCSKDDTSSSRSMSSTAWALRVSCNMGVQVLLACIKCPGSHLLTNQNLIDIFQACFRIGHYQGDSNSSKGMQGAILARTGFLSACTQIIKNDRKPIQWQTVLKKNSSTASCCQAGVQVSTSMVCSSGLSPRQPWACER